MGELFRGWRRKFGVATLVMALVFMGGWVRSPFLTDSFSVNSFWPGSGVRQGMFSSNGVLLWIKVKDGSDCDFGLVPDFPAFQLPGFGSSRSNSNNALLMIFDRNFKWSFDSLGFGIGSNVVAANKTPGAPSIAVRLLKVPYWSIVIPLTLISAWLLPPTTRKSTLKEITQPIPE